MRSESMAQMNARRKARQQQPDGRTREITVTGQCGGVAIVDAVDFDRVKRYSWGRSRSVDSITCKSGRTSYILSHLILGVGKGCAVKPCDGDPFNCRRENLKLYR